jgi:hypothetical protein
MYTCSDPLSARFSRAFSGVGLRFRPEVQLLLQMLFEVCSVPLR